MPLNLTAFSEEGLIHVKIGMKSRPGVRASLESGERIFHEDGLVFRWGGIFHEFRSSPLKPESVDKLDFRFLGQGKLSHLRTKDGAEVDFIIERGGTLTPIEVKWSEKPSLRDARHLLTFMNEHPRLAKQSFIVCRCPRPLQLHEKVTALPWFCL